MTDRKMGRAAGLNLSGMDRTTLLQYLGHAEKHIETSRQRIERQLAAVHRLKPAGHDASTAHKLLAQLSEALSSFESDRDRILHLLREPDSSPARSRTLPSCAKVRSRSSTKAIFAPLVRRLRG